MKKQQLYIKNEKGRYEPYKEPERDNALYRKIGNRYEPVKMTLGDYYSQKEWDEGVFAITKNQGCESWISAGYLRKVFSLYKCGDIEKVSIAKLGGMAKLADHLARHWHELPKDNVTIYDMAHNIVAIMMNLESEEKKNRECIT